METSWEKSSQWYDEIVGEKGHTYHQEIILPALLKLLDLKPNDHLLDVGCGQGVFARALPKGVKYTGIDASPTLIKKAKSTYPAGQFIVTDATKPYQLKEKATHAICILCLQNMSDPKSALKQLAGHTTGKVILVLNHPCFRIPRQSSWGIDESKKIQYRRIDRYMTPLQVPIQTHPGKGGESTLSFHFPLSYWTSSCKDAGIVIHDIQEWCSHKESTGRMARMENRAREEFPLFLTLIGRTEPKKP